MAIQVNGTTVINNSRQLTNIASVDAATVTALGNAGVGGVDWYQSNWRSAPTSSGHKMDADGNNVIIGLNNYDGVWYSTDGGATFTETNSGFTGNNHVKDVAINGNVAVGVGAWSTIIRSTNGGASWGNYYNPGSWMEGVHNNGSTFIACGQSGKIARSTDNGVNWSTTTAPTGSTHMNCLANNGNTWIVIGDNARINRSTNNGASWTDLGVQTQLGQRSINAIAYGNGVWIVGNQDGDTYMSNNNGSNWYGPFPTVHTSSGDLATDGSGNWVFTGNRGVVAIPSGTSITTSSVPFSGGIYAGTGSFTGAAYANNRFWGNASGAWYGDV